MREKVFTFCESELIDSQRSSTFAGYPVQPVTQFDETETHLHGETDLGNITEYLVKTTINF